MSESRTVHRVMVTGANGYLGRHVVTALGELGVAVTAVARSEPSEPVEGVRSMVADVFAPSTELMGAVAEVDALIHLAWQDGFVLHSRKHGEQLSGHYGFLMRAADSGVSRIAVAGTMHEVGYWEGAVTADTPENPQTPYGVAKRSLRQLLESSLAPLEVSLAWLRCYYIVGDDEHSQSIFSKLRAAELRGDPTFPFTTGKNLYDFIDVEVLARQIAAASVQTAVSGVINCCSGEPVSLADRVERCIVDNGYSIRLEYGAFPDRPFDSPGIWGDDSDIRRILTDA